MLTPRQLFELQQQWAAEHQPKEDAAPSAAVTGTTSAYEGPRTVDTISALAKVLGYTWRRANDLAKSGAIDDAICYWKGKYTYNVPMILDIIKMSNREALQRKMNKRGQRTA
jgi:hypothetical protein